VYWPKWDSFDLYQFDFFRRTWKHYPDIRPQQRFLYFSSICHLPKNLGMFILGGSDADDNFSKRNTYFSRYQRFVEKAPMMFKRAFFASIFSVSDSSVYVFGGSDGQQDLNACERYSLVDNTWQQITPMSMRRNGSSCVAFEKAIFVFGGNEQDVGSLDSIEKYTIETDKWTITRVRLREPVHDSVAFPLGGQRVLIFGGSVNNTTNAHFDVYDLTCDLLGAVET
jgi:N-acetylneuraminic acid mutarotase